MGDKIFFFFFKLEEWNRIMFYCFIYDMALK